MFERDRYAEIPHGEDRLEYLKKCIAEADSEKNIDDMLELRHVYIREATFYDDSFKALIMFPEYMKLFEENPDVIEPLDFMIPFKWILENSGDYYQVNKAQIEKYFERFEFYIKKFGYTMRTYYLKKYEVYRDIDTEKALAAYDEFEKYERSDLSDCAACEAGERTKKAIHFGDIEGAVKILNEMSERNMTCSEVPQNTYGEFAYEFAKRGMYSEADHYIDLMLPMIKGNEINFMREIAYAVSVKSETDPQHAYDIFCDNAGNYTKMKTPALKYCFAAAAYRLFARLEKEGVKEIHPRISNESEIFRADGIYNVTELKKYFYDAAKNIAEKFDGRNCNTIYSDDLEYKFPEAPEKKFSLPLHGSITPEPFAMGILFKTKEDIPPFEDIAEIIKEKIGFSGGRADTAPNGMALLSFHSESSEKYIYRAVIADAPDIHDYLRDYDRSIYGDTDKCKSMLLIISDNIRNDRYEDMRMNFALMDAVNIGGAKMIYAFPNNIFGAAQVKYIALSKAPPTVKKLIDLSLSDSENDKASIETRGLLHFGSRELIIRDVVNEVGNINFCAAFLLKLAEAVTYGTLPDEGITMNSGMVYDESNFIRFGWRAFTSPDDVDEIFAEPVIYLTPADIAAKKGRLVTEITDEEIGKISPRIHSRAERYDRQRNKNLFPYALEYYMKNDCGLFISLDHTFVEDGEEVYSYINAQMCKNGRAAVVTGKYEGDGYVNVGDIIDVDAEKVFYFCIEENDETFEADEIYLLLGDDKNV